MSDKFRRKKEPKHIRLYATITGSEAWRHLSGNAVKVLLALVARDDGTRNGTISFSVREASESANLSVPTATRCLQELVELGFIRCTEKGAFSRKVSHASTWRYTWAAWPGGSPSAPTRDFEKWKLDEKTRCKNFHDTVQVSLTETEMPPPPVQDIYTGNAETPHVSVVEENKESCTHTIYQGDNVFPFDTEQRKRANPSPGAEMAGYREELVDYLSEKEVGTQTRLAQLLGIPAGTFSKFLNGSNLPDRYHAAVRDVFTGQHRDDHDSPA